MIIWLAFTCLGLMLLGGALVWAGLFAEAPGPLPANLPHWVVSLFSIPLAVALGGYGVAIWRSWRRQSAVNAWLVGAGGHLFYIVADIALSSGISPGDLLSWDAFGLLARVFAPGVILLMIDRDRIENPFRAPV